MKTVTIQFLILAVVLMSCSKRGSIPPSVNLIVGTRTTGYNEGFVAFKSQSEIDYNQLDTIDVIRIRIIEKHLDSSYFLGPGKRPVFNVDVTTSIDKQNYLTGSNCRLCGWFGGGIAGDYMIDGEIEFPIRISNNATLDNNIIELNNGDDYILISYASKYSKLTTKASLFIYKHK